MQACRSPQRHQECETGLVRRGFDRQRSFMGFRDLGRDMQAEAQPLKAAAHLSTKKRLEQVDHGRIRDRLARIGDREFEHPTIGRGRYPDGMIG